MRNTLIASVVKGKILKEGELLMSYFSRLFRFALALKFGIHEKNGYRELRFYTIFLPYDKYLFIVHKNALHIGLIPAILAIKLVWR